jgi:hypothetical protein
VSAVHTARVDGAPGTLEVTSDALLVDGRALPWVDLDHVDVDAPRLHVRSVDGTAHTLSHLATAFDRVVEELVEARSRARRAALCQWTGDAPLATFDAKRGDERVRVVLFPDGLTAEPLTGRPDMLPLSCLVRIDRDGYDLTLRARGLPDVHLRHLGSRTDEFLQRVERAVADLRDRTRAAYRSLAPELDGLDAADGWAVDARTAGPCWTPLRAAVAGQRRAEELDLLAGLAGDRLRLGVKCRAGSATLTFALAPVHGRVAVEATDTEDRATFVFATDDVERLNAVLLATSFRREALARADRPSGAVGARRADARRGALGPCGARRPGRARRSLGGAGPPRPRRLSLRVSGCDRRAGCARRRTAR